MHPNRQSPSLNQIFQNIFHLILQTCNEFIGQYAQISNSESQIFAFRIPRFVFVILCQVHITYTCTNCKKLLKQIGENIPFFYSVKAVKLSTCCTQGVGGQVFLCPRGQGVGSALNVHESPRQVGRWSKQVKIWSTQFVNGPFTKNVPYFCRLCS